jgi:hypothetical protein
MATEPSVRVRASAGLLIVEAVRMSPGSPTFVEHVGTLDAWPLWRACPDGHLASAELDARNAEVLAGMISDAAKRALGLQPPPS